MNTFLISIIAIIFTIVMVLLTFYFMIKLLKGVNIHKRYKLCQINQHKPYKHNIRLKSIGLDIMGNLHLNYECRSCKEYQHKMYQYNSVLYILHNKFNVPRSQVLELRTWMENLPTMSAQLFVDKLIEINKRK